MLKSRQTKKVLLSSILSMLVCVAMLIGSTFAWFTDSVKSGNNKIVAGNLDIDLEYSKDKENWNDVENSSTIFDQNALWEPGYTDVVYLRISNKGSLALKYQLSVVAADETTGINQNDQEIKLSDYIKFGQVEDVMSKFDSRENAIQAVDANALPINKGYTFSSNMQAGASDKIIALVVYMPNAVGNEANYKSGTNIPTINLGLQINATQLSSESDSFDNTYDSDAPYYLPAEVTKETFDANGALAYVGGKYYENVADAIAVGGDVYLMPGCTTNFANAHTSIPGNGITLYANGATFNKDLSIDTYDLSANGKTDGIYDGIDTVNITVYDAKNLYLWGQRNSSATVNIRMVGCTNTGIGANFDQGRTVYLTGISGTTNIVLENTTISNTDSPVYTNANGTIQMKNCKFNDCSVPVNINYKSESGIQNVLIDSCSFIHCGCENQFVYGDGTMGDYAAPIRVVHSKAGSTQTVTVKNTSVVNTVGSNGDMLIVIHKGGTQPVKAILENNQTDIRISNSLGISSQFTTVNSGTTQTVIGQ